MAFNLCRVYELRLHCATDESGLINHGIALDHNTLKAAAICKSILANMFYSCRDCYLG